MSILFDDDRSRPAGEEARVNVEHDSLYVRFEQLRRMMTVIAVRAQGKGNERPDIQNVAEDALRLLDLVRGQVLK